MRVLNFVKLISLTLAAALSAFAMSGCSSGSNASAIDTLFGAGSNAPVLSAVPTQIIQQLQQLKVDINNVKKSATGDDKDMAYSCQWSRQTGGPITAPADCSTLPNGSATFDTGAGILKWVPSTNELGQFQVTIVGTNQGGSDQRQFTVDVRLAFAGLESLTNVQGDRMTLNWTPSLQATGYQVLTKNSDGTYSVFQTVTDPTVGSITLLNLTPLQNYTFRVAAIDRLGQLDGNTVSLSAVTADLIRLEVTSAASQLSPGQSTTVTVRLKDNAGNYILTSGLSVGVALSGNGTSSGTFSAVNDLGNGVYTSIFTATSPGTADTITANLPQFYFVEHAAPIQVMPLQIEIAASATTLNPNQAITLTAHIRDFTGALMSTGGQGLQFNISGGTSTATISSAIDLGTGTYTATLTGAAAGTAVTVGATLATTSTIYSTVQVQVVPYTLEITSTLTDLSVSRSTTVTAKVKDWQGNYLATGGQGVVFGITGSTGILNLGATTDNHNGTYTATVTGLSLGSVVVTAVMTPSYAVTQTASITVRKLRLEIISSAAHLMPAQTATLTGRVKDWQGNLVGTGGEALSFSASGGTSSGTIGTVTDNGNGTYTATFTASSAGTVLTVSGSITDSYQVDLSASMTVEKWRVYVATSASSVQTGQTVTATVTVKDYLDNVAAAGGQTVTIASSGGTSTINAGAVTDNGDGTYTSVLTGVTAGTVTTVSASLNQSYQVISTAALTVGAIYLKVTTAQAQMNPDQSAYVYAQVVDSSGNNLTAGSYAISFSYSGGTSTGTFGAVTYQGNGLYRSLFTGSTGGTAITITAASTSTYNVSSTSQITVVPWSLKITASSTAVTVGQSITLTGKVYDYTGTLVATGGKGFAMAAVTPGVGTLSAVVDNSDGTYTASFAANAVGSTQISGTITSSYTLSSTVTLTSTAVHLALTVGQSYLNPGDGVTVTATVKDAAGNNLLSNGYTIGFTYSGGTSTGSLGSTINLGTGQYTSVFTGNVAGTATTITANASVPFVVDSTVTLQVKPWNIVITASATNYAIYESGTITAVVKDWNNATVASGGKGVSLSLASAGIGAISATTDNSDGTYTANFQATGVGSVAVAANMSQSFTVSSTPTLVVGKVYLYVTVGSGSSSANVNSGNTVTATVTLKNSSGTVVTGTGYSLTFATSGGTSSVTATTSVTSVSTGVYSITYQGVLAGTALTVSASANVSYVSSATATITVLPGTTISAGNSSLTIASTSVRSGSTVALTATMKDPAGNVVPGLTVSFAKTSGTGIGSGTFSTVTDNGDGTYSDTFTGTSQGANPMTISTAAGGVTVVQTVGLTVTSGVPSTMTLSGPTTGSGGACTSAYALSFADSAGNSTTLTSATTFTVTGLGSYASLYSDASCTSSISSLAVASGVSTSQNFYLKTYYPGNYTLAFTGGGITQSNTLTTVIAPIVSWVGAAGIPEAYGTANAYTQGYFDGTFTTIQGIQYYNDGTNGYLFVTDTGNQSVQKIRVTNLASISVIGALGKVGYPKGVPTGGTNSSYCTGISSATGVNGAFCTGGQYTNGNGDAQFYTPGRTTTMTIGGVNYLFVSDYNNHRLMKYNADTGAFIGWDGYTTTATTSCLNGTTPTTNTLANNATTGWCLGGTPAASLSATYVTGSTTNGNVFRNPNYITNDGTYLYVYDAYNRIVAIDPSSGMLVKWLGRIASTASAGISGTGNGLACVSTQSDGSSAADGYFSPSWCTGGYIASANLAQGASSNVYLNPQWTNIRGIIFYSDATYNWMVVSDYTTGRLARYFCGLKTTTPNCVSSSPVSITTGGNTASHGEGEFFGYSGWVYTAPTSSGGSIPASINSSAFFTNTQSATTNAATGGWAYYGNTTTSGGEGGLFYNQGLTVNGTTAYLVSSYNTRVDKINLLTGAFTGWVGRVSSLPSSGATGCASASPGTVTPGWCYGGSATNGAMVGAYGSPIDVTNDGTYLYVADQGNYRIAIVNMSTGLGVGEIGLRLNTTPSNWSTTPFAAGSVMPTNTSLNSWYPARDSVFNNANQISINGNYMYVVDNGSHRVKRYNWLDGSYQGWIGLTASASPTGGDAACVGAITGGFTPGWCQGGGFGAGLSGAPGFYFPSGAVSDGTYLYVTDSSNARIVKVRISDSTFMGWFGYIGGTSPSDGAPGCSGATGVTPGWCLGGTAANPGTFVLGSFNGPSGISGFTDTDGKFYLIVGDNSGRLQKIDVSNPSGNISWIGYAAANVTGCNAGAATSTTGWCTTSGITTSSTNTASPAYAENGYIAGPSSIYVDTTTTPAYVYVTSNQGRIQRYNATTGAFAGWVGLVGVAANTAANANCYGGASETNGVVTPGWCHGGTSSATNNTTTVGQFGGGIGGIYADANYVYASDTANHRIQRFNKTTGAYGGWIGRVNSTPTGGGSACTTLSTNSITPTWCLGGSSKPGYLLDQTNQRSAFDTPMGISGMGSYLYIVDQANGRIISMPSN